MEHFTNLLFLSSRAEQNSEADVTEFKAKKKELEETVQPIIAKLYAGGAGPKPDGDEVPTSDDGKDEL